MHIVIFGLTISSSWGNGHATLWRGLCRALAAHGHAVTFFERDVPYYAAHRDLFELAGRRSALVLYGHWDDVREHAARAVAEADAAIVTSFCPDALRAEALACETCRGLRVFYDLDAPVTLASLDTSQPVEYIGPYGLAAYDLVLSYTGGRILDDLKHRLGARATVALYGSVDPQAHTPADPVDLFRADLSYLGTYAADRQGALERLFIRPAEREPSRRFVLGGSQYPPDFPWTANMHYMSHVAPDWHRLFYSSSRLTLNVTRRAMADAGFCPSGRLFEAAACGAPILSDWWAGLDEFFEPGREILVAHSTEDAVEAMHRGDGELRAIGQRARERALADHTAEARARELESLLSAAVAA